MQQSKTLFTTNYQYYLLNEEYMTSTKLSDYVKECQRFYNGDQWPENNLNNMIRTTVNILSYSSNFKASKINGTPQYIQYTSNNGKDCTHLERFDEYNLKKLKETTFNFQTILDSLNNGTAISYLTWDKDDTSYKGIYKGGLVQQQIDILRFGVANPYIEDIQKQKWVMFWYKAEVNAVRDLVKRDSDKETEEIRKKIIPDNADNESFGENFDETKIAHGVVTVYVRFFRIDGEVYHTMSTKYADIYEYPQALSPIANKNMKPRIKKLVEDYKKDLQDQFKKSDKEVDFNKIMDLKIDYENMVNQVVEFTDFKEETYKKVKEKFNLYPFPRLVLYKINGSFYGRSDIKALIPAQKAINFNMSMMMKCIENNAYNKIFVKEDTLQGQEITNEPSQVLVDYTGMTNGWGIKFAESQPLPNGVADFTNNMIDMIRVFGGFNQVMDGTVTNQNISGYALQQQIKQSNSAIEQQQQIFWSYLQDKAAIRLLYYKFYVDEASYTYEIDDSEIEEQEVARKTLKNKKEQGLLNLEGELDFNTPTHKIKVEHIKGEDLLGSDYDINIDVQQGMLNSELSEAQVWDTLIINGGIQNLSPEMLELYLYANPIISQATKDKLKHIVTKQKKEENYQLKQANQELMMKAKQLSDIVLQMQAQNQYKDKYIDNLTKEFTDKINVANKYVKEVEKQSGLATKGVSEGEAKSNNARGIAGSNIQ